LSRKRLEISGTFRKVTKRDASSGKLTINLPLISAYNVQIHYEWGEFLKHFFGVSC
jgi:hypothetical protein